MSCEKDTMNFKKSEEKFSVAMNAFNVLCRGGR